MLAALKVGTEIEYQVQVGKHNGKHWQKYRGRVVQVTDRHIAIQTPKYPDSISITELITGRARILNPVMDFSGVRMHNRVTEQAAIRERQETKDRIEGAEEGAEQMSMAAKQDMVGYKYNWVENGPKVTQMLAEGKTIPDIARELDYPYHAVRDYIKRHLPDKPKPSEDVCPAGREDSPHPATVPPVNQGSSPLLEREPVELLPGGGLLPNTTKLIAVDGEYQRRIFERFHSQRKKGIGKYGQPLEDNPASRDERLEHLAQELTDGLMYVEWIKAQPHEYGFREYAIAALRTAQQTNDRELLLNGVFGLVGEAGEVVDHLKKHLFQGHVLDAAKVADELGDVLWYVNLIAAACGCELDAIAKGNIDKLLKRYPGEGFDAACSVNRVEGTD